MRVMCRADETSSTVTCFVQAENGLWLCAHDEAVRGDTVHRSVWEVSFTDSGTVALKETSTSSWLREDGYGGVLAVPPTKLMTHGVLNSEHWGVSYAGQPGRFLLRSLMTNRYLFLPPDGLAHVAEAGTVYLGLDAAALRFYMTSAAPQPTPAPSQLIYYTAPNPTLYHHTITSAAVAPTPISHDTVARPSSTEVLASSSGARLQSTSTPPPLAPRPQLAATVHRAPAPQSQPLSSSVSSPSPTSPISSSYSSSAAPLGAPVPIPAASRPLSSSGHVVSSRIYPGTVVHVTTHPAPASASPSAPAPASASALASPPTHTPVNAHVATEAPPALPPRRASVAPPPAAASATAASVSVPSSQHTRPLPAPTKHHALVHQQSSPAILPQPPRQEAPAASAGAAAAPAAVVPVLPARPPSLMRRQTTSSAITPTEPHLQHHEAAQGGGNGKDALAPMREFTSLSQFAARLGSEASAPPPPIPAHSPTSASSASSVSATVHSAPASSPSPPPAAAAAAAAKSGTPPPRPSTPAPALSLSTSSARPQPMRLASPPSEVKRVSTYAPFVECMHSSPPTSYLCCPSNTSCKTKARARARTSTWRRIACRWGATWTSTTPPTRSSAPCCSASTQWYAQDRSIVCGVSCW